MNLGSFEPGFLAPELANVNLKRNYLTLFDSMKNEAVRLDVTLGISLLERNESQRLQDKLERATVSGVPVTATPQQVFAAGPTKRQGPSGELENLDPNTIIREGTTRKAESPVKQLTREREQRAQPVQPPEIKEEIGSDEADVELDRKVLAIERDQMQSMAHEQKQKQSDFYAMLTQPY